MYSIGALMGGIDVLGIDITLERLHETVRKTAEDSKGKLQFYCGSSTDPATLRHVVGVAEGRSRVMVLLDSDHKAEHVLRELELYSKLVAPGMFIVVEDSNVDLFSDQYDLPDYKNNGPGRAIREFLARPEEQHRWEQNPVAERHLLTFNPGGYLRRVAVDGEVDPDVVL